MSYGTHVIMKHIGFFCFNM